MQIISHRGFWLNSTEKNQKVAFERSKNYGLGTETDVRDNNQNLVISHDMPHGNEMNLLDFLKIYEELNPPLALNVKADGLAKHIKETLSKTKLSNWFVFDMSIPDTISHLKEGNPIFSRVSDIEIYPIFLEEASGIWVDGFHEDYRNTELIESVLEKNKKICFVSPELHKRPYKNYWQYIKKWEGNTNVILCTDFPSEAKGYFKL